MGSDEITFKVNASAAQGALTSLDGSLKKTGASIDGVRNTLEKVFAAQAILASASRVKQAIEEVTASMEAQTSALQQVIQANKSAASTMDQLAEASQRSRDAASGIDETVASYKPLVELAKSIPTIALGPMGSVFKIATDEAGKFVQSQEEIAEALKREAQLADEALKKRKEGEAFLERDRRERASLAREKEAQAKAEEEAAKKELEALEKRKESTKELTESVWKGIEAIRERRKAEADAMATNFKQAMSDQSQANRERKASQPDFEEVATEMKRQQTVENQARVRESIASLGGTRGKQLSGGAREARRAQELEARAAEARAIGSGFDADLLQSRADRANEKAASRIARNEARSARQSAFKAQQRGDFDEAKRQNKRAQELDKAGSTQKSEKAGEKSLDDLYKILSERLPQKSS